MTTRFQEPVPGAVVNDVVPVAKPAIEVREMALEDLAAVFALGERVFSAGAAPNLYRTWDEYEPVEFFASDGETCLVAEDEFGRIVGFVLGTLIEKRRSAWNYGYVVWLCVAPEARRLGVARALVEQVTDVFIDQGARMMIVDTEADNDEALAFFRREGFEKPVEHVYLTKNLTWTEAYRRSRRRQRDRLRPLRRG